MFIKVYLGLMLVLCGVVVGLMCRARFVERKKVMMEYKTYIEYLLNQIVYFKTPFITATENYFKRNDIPLQKLSEMEKKIRENGLSKWWRDYVNENTDKYKFSEEEKDALMYPSFFLGQSGAVEQKKHFEQLISDINECIKALEADLKIKGTSYLKISVFSGITLALIII